jgi:hypothetical protein
MNQPKTLSTKIGDQRSLLNALKHTNNPRLPEKRILLQPNANPNPPIDPDILASERSGQLKTSRVITGHIVPRFARKINMDSVITTPTLKFPQAEGEAGTQLIPRYSRSMGSHDPG